MAAAGSGSSAAYGGHEAAAYLAAAPTTTPPVKPAPQAAKPSSPAAAPSAAKPAAAAGATGRTAPAAPAATSTAKTATPAAKPAVDPALAPAVHGSTAGLLTAAPIYAAGVQVGNYGGTGLSLQRLAVPGGGAVNLQLGIDAGALGISADYVLFASDQFHLLQLRTNSDYNQMRGQLLLYFGGGFGMQRGAYLRVPIGVQYTMLRDPITFFGGFALALGPFGGDDSVGPEAWLSLGIRLLL